MKKPIIAGNWKMNNTKAEAEQLITALKPLVKDVTRTDVVVCVPYTCIEKVKKLVKGSKIKVGAENVAWADKGAFTGEISAAMLKEVGNHRSQRTPSVFRRNRQNRKYAPRAGS